MHNITTMLNSVNRHPTPMWHRGASSPATVVGILMVGVVIGAGVFLIAVYSSGTLSAKTSTETTTQTSTIVSIETVTTTSTLTTTSLPQFAQASVNAVNMSHALPILGLAATCSTSPRGSAYLTVQNNGTISVSARDVTLVPSGKPSATVGLSETKCLISAGGTLFITITSLDSNWTTLTMGEPYTGYLTLSDDTIIPFGGSFT